MEGTALIAVVEQNGMPRERIVLDRFRAGPPRIGRVRRIRARLSRRGVLKLSWTRADGVRRGPVAKRTVRLRLPAGRV